MSDPYRTLADLPRPRLSFGDPCRGPWAIVGGLALIAVTLAMFLLASWSGGHFNGSIALPAIFGALMILRTRWGAMKLAATAMC